MREESPKDLEFVERMSKELGVRFYGESVDVPALIDKARGRSPEETARNVRYEFLSKSCC